MGSRTLVSCVLLSALVLILLSTAAQAAEYRETNAEIKAEDILNHIEKGDDVYLDNCSIVGELNVSSLKLKAVPNPTYCKNLNKEWDTEGTFLNGINENLSVVESNINIGHSIFENGVNFSNTLLQNNVRFFSVTFNDSADFKGSTFNSYVDFTSTTFNDSAYFKGTIFNGSTDIYGNNYSADYSDTIFHGSADFEGTTFNNLTYFSDMTFNDSADFSHATFYGSADFSGITFYDSADFYGITFYDSADFCVTIFNDRVGFFGTVFHGFANFDCTTFNGSAYFEGTIFNDSANFEGATFNDSAYFEGTIFNGSAYFSDTFFKTTFNGSAYFEGTIFNGSANFEDTIFNGSANFKDTIFNDYANFRGPDTPENIKTDGKSCEIFRKYYESEAQYEYADIIYYNHRKFSQDNKDLTSFSKWSDFLSCITCGYGVRPFRILYSGVLIVGVFTLLYWQGKGIYRSSDTGEKKSKVSFWDALYFSISTFTTLGSADWYPTDSFRKWVTLEGLLGWIMLGIFMATLTAVMIRV